MLSRNSAANCATFMRSAAITSGTCARMMAGDAGNRVSTSAMTRAATLKRVVTAAACPGRDGIAVRGTAAVSLPTFPPAPVAARDAGNGRGSSRESLCVAGGGRPARGGAINWSGSGRPAGASRRPNTWCNRVSRIGVMPLTMALLVEALASHRCNAGGAVGLRQGAFPARQGHQAGQLLAMLQQASADFEVVVQRPLQHAVFGKAFLLVQLAVFFHVGERGHRVRVGLALADHGFPVLLAGQRHHARGLAFQFAINANDLATARHHVFLFLCHDGCCTVRGPISRHAEPISSSSCPASSRAAWSLFKLALSRRRAMYSYSEANRCARSPPRSTSSAANRPLLTMSSARETASPFCAMRPACMCMAAVRIATPAPSNNMLISW